MYKLLAGLFTIIWLCKSSISQATSSHEFKAKDSPIIYKTNLKARRAPSSSLTRPDTLKEDLTRNGNNARGLAHTSKQVDKLLGLKGKKRGVSREACLKLIQLAKTPKNVLKEYQTIQHFYPTLCDDAFNKAISLIRNFDDAFYTANKLRNRFKADIMADKAIKLALQYLKTLPPDVRHEKADLLHSQLGVPREQLLRVVHEDNLKATSSLGDYKSFEEEEATLDENEAISFQEKGKQVDGKKSNKQKEEVEIEDKDIKQAVLQFNALQLALVNIKNERSRAKLIENLIKDLHELSKKEPGEKLVARRNEEAIEREVKGLEYEKDGVEPNLTLIKELNEQLVVMENEAAIE